MPFGHVFIFEFVLRYCVSNFSIKNYVPPCLHRLWFIVCSQKTNVLLAKHAPCTRSTAHSCVQRLHVHKWHEWFVICVQTSQALLLVSQLYHLLFSSVLVFEKQIIHLEPATDDSREAVRCEKHERHDTCVWVISYCLCCFMRQISRLASQIIVAIEAVIMHEIKGFSHAIRDKI